MTCHDSQQIESWTISAIGALRKSAAIDLLDECYGVGCYADLAKSDLRKYLLSAYRKNKVSSASILDQYFASV